MARHERLTRLAILLAATTLVATACSSQTGTATAPSQPPPSATASQPAVATPAAPSASTQPMEIVGKFALEPARGQWDTKVTATATGMKPNTKYDLMWTTGKVAWKLSDDKSKYLGRDARTIQQALGSYTSDPNGAFVATFTVPRGFGYAHDVVVVDAEKIIRNKSLFDVDMVTTVTPSSGPVGTPITIEVKGIGYQAYQNSFQLTYDNAYTGWVSSVTTDGYAKFVIPATGAVGTHVIALGHSDFGAPYMNPNQQPVVASRPFPHIPFTVTEGTAVMPTAAEKQGFAQVAGRPVTQGIWSEPYATTVGTPVTLNAKGLLANSEIELFWTTQVGNRTVTGFEERTSSIGKTKTDASGAFAWTFNMLDDLGGTHTITAKLGDKEVAKTTTYILAQAFPLDVSRGPAGTKTTLHIKGAGWTENEQIYHVVVDNAYTGYACAFNSKGDLTIYLTMSGAPGWHYIDLYPGIYQGPLDAKPADYKIPQLTADADHPGEKMPIFRWAFFITAP